MEAPEPVERNDGLMIRGEREGRGMSLSGFSQRRVRRLRESKLPNHGNDDP